MKIEFEKMSGAGNDFIVIDNRDKKIRNRVSAAKKLCDRHWGIGADGLLLIEKSKSVAYRMMYFNADGSYGGMCGNGGRCIALFAYKHGIAKKKHSFDALNHIYLAEIKSNSVVQLQMKDPIGMSLSKVLNLHGGSLTYHAINTGSPHIIVDCSNEKDLSTVDVHGLGHELRYHSAFQPEGTNVNFIKNIGLNKAALRTYERGVEGETLACGTGSVASAIIASRIWKFKSPITIVPTSGVALSVSFNTNQDKTSNVLLTGPAKTIFTGSFTI